MTNHSRRELNTIIADQEADQIAAMQRDGIKLPGDGFSTAAAVRLIDPSSSPPQLREAVDALLDAWSRENDVDRKF